MCGIFSKFTHGSENVLKQSYFKTDPHLLEILKCRGPDAYGNLCIYFDHKNEIFESENVENNESATNVNFENPIGKLELSGHTLWMQGKSADVQPLNENYGSLLFNGDLFDTEWVKENSDTRALLEKLECNSLTNQEQINEHILAVLKSLNGPFSFIYFEKKTKALYFCRDRIGRRSLLLYQDDNSFILSSILTRKYKSAIELPSDSIYRFSCITNTLNEFSWNADNNIGRSQEIELNEWFSELKIKSEKDQSRNENPEITKISVYPMDENKCIETVNFLNTTAKNCLHNFEFLEAVNKNERFSEITDNLIKYLSNSVKSRIQTQPKYCSKCIKTLNKCENHCTVGILFSGGLDCTILAVLAHRFIPIDESIDLINVAFSKANNDTYNTPDRCTSEDSLKTLNELFPERKWNLIKIDVTQEELHEMQKEIIADLIFPLKTILDESLGSALWFAARGKSSECKSTCRILLTGVGADELFGGYLRHRNAFNRHGWPALEYELKLDWQRISTRNLARDDRVISYHGRQPRMPYLDEAFVRFTQNLRAWDRCYPDIKYSPGVGDKMALRLVAMKLGLANTTFFPKRALQFGSKIANSKENGKDISKRLALE